MSSETEAFNIHVSCWQNEKQGMGRENELKLKNRDLYELNSEIHNINTRFSSDLHTPSANLTTFQKAPFYFGIKDFNHLPTSIKHTSHDINQFKIKKFPSYKSILLIGETFCLEFQ